LCARGAILAWLLCAVTSAQELVQPPPAEQVPPAEDLPDPLNITSNLPSPDKMVIDVQVQGNKNLTTARVMQFIRTRPGRAFDVELVEKDVRQMNKSRMFVDVRPRYQETAEGVIVIFEVVERRTIKYVKFLGRTRVRRMKVLTEKSGVKEGDALDPYAIEDGRRRLEDYYRERGHNKVRVTTIEGDKPQDRGVVFLIHEGPVQRVRTIDFVGNTIVGDQRLKTQIESKRPFLFLFKGFVDRDKVNDDVDRLTAYYRSLGFFQAEIGREMKFNDERDRLDVTFVINEGPRYTVRNVTFVGNTKFKTEELSKDLGLKSGDFFDQAKMNADLSAVQDIYGGDGYIFTKVQADPRFDDQPGILDLVYQVEEGARYHVNNVIVKINGEGTHTKQTVVLNRVSIRPGDIADVRELRDSERRLKMSAVFANNPAQGQAPRLTFVPPDADEEEMMAEGPGRGPRGQSPDTPLPAAPKKTNSQPVAAPTESNRAPGPDKQSRATIPAHKLVIRGQSPQGSAPAPLNPIPRQMPAQQLQPIGSVAQRPQSAPLTPATAYAPLTNTAPAPQQAQGFAVGQSPVTTQTTATPVSMQPNPSIYEGNPPGGYASPGELYPEGGYMRLDEPTQPVDIIANVDETQTGRIMLGVGVNSNAGLVGSLVVEEQNFDITRFPRGWRDFTSGQAFRGDGQQFRVEAVPGTQVQRYMFTFREPYLFDSNISFGVSGYYYTRLYTDWTEQRLGGQLTWGYQLRPDLSLVGSVRAEDVNISDPTVPTPPELQRVIGDNGLYTGRLALVHDTRDSQFMPTQGHRLELGYEQGFGDFDYPRGTIDVRQHFLVRERADRSGRHVFTVKSEAGFSGNDTPIFENFFAGGFGTLRGFRFRGASPRDMNVVVGGEFMWVNTLEYMFPITADDMLRAVVFCDAGTVEQDITLNSNNFRVAPGFGLRISIPAMGPAPIALDLAVPVAHADGDEIQNFSFFVGVGY
jgi:outer membrane protein insertion porin family